jgi:uncharacterized membrane protein
MEKVFLSLLFLLTACTKSVEVVDVPSFQKHVQPIIRRSCVQCHVGPQDWSKYEIAKANAGKIYERVVRKKDMPRGVFMSDADRRVIQLWVERGLLP